MSDKRILVRAGKYMPRRTQVKIHPEVIIRERLKRGWKQHELAEHAGLRRNEVSILENEARASPRIIKSVAEALGIEIDAFVEITPPD